MSVIAPRRTVITLYSGSSDVASHRARIVLAEKRVVHEIVEVSQGNLPEDLIDLNPYNTLPTLLDRDLVLYDSRVIMEYIDERFPHPPLMPVDPVSRARTRLMLYRIERDWYSLLPSLEASESAKKEKARRELRESITSIAPVFESKPYFMSTEFSMLDCVIAPLLWRLAVWGVVLPPAAKAVEEYAKRLFARPTFTESLTRKERSMRS